MARGDELLRAQQQRRDAVGFTEEARRAVGVFIAAEDDGQKVLLFCRLFAACRGNGMSLIVLGEVFERELNVARVGDEGAAALHGCFLALAGQEHDARVLAV